MALQQGELMSIAETIVNDFNDSQSFDSYYFEDSGITIAWWSERDTYTALKDDKTWEDYSPDDIHIVIEDLTEKDLKNYMKDVHGKGKFRIRYTDTMDSYLLDYVFDSEKEAQHFIDTSEECRPYPSNFFEVD